MNDSVSSYLKVGVHPKTTILHAVVGDVLKYFNEPQTYLLLKKFFTNFL
jgi:hypothetical protein